MKHFRDIGNHGFRLTKHCRTELSAGGRAPVERESVCRKPGHMTPRQRQALEIIRECPTTTRKVAQRMHISMYTARMIVVVLKGMDLIETEARCGGGIRVKETT